MFRYWIASPCMLTSKLGTLETTCISVSDSMSLSPKSIQGLSLVSWSRNKARLWRRPDMLGMSRESGVNVYESLTIQCFICGSLGSWARWSNHLTISQKFTFFLQFVVFCSEIGCSPDSFVLFRPWNVSPVEPFGRRQSLTIGEKGFQGISNSQVWNTGAHRKGAMGKVTPKQICSVTVIQITDRNRQDKCAQWWRERCCIEYYKSRFCGAFWGQIHNRTW